MVPPNFVKFFLSFIFTYSENFICSESKWLKFEFWHPCLRGIFSFWYPQILSYFIFASNFPILKITHVQREWLKISNFGGPV